jgi:hypothetical protein
LLIAYPVIAIIWLGLLGSLAFCVATCFAGLYMFITSFNDVIHDKYFALSIFLISLPGIYWGISRFRSLKNTFNSGEIIIEQLLPFIGIILLLLTFIGIVIHLGIMGAAGPLKNTISAI